MYPKKKLTCRSWSVIAPPSNKAECSSIGRFQRSKPHCWVQETSRMKENEIWNHHMYLKKELTCRSWSVIATPSNKAECVVIGKSQRTKPYCWVQETSRMKENEIWNHHMYPKKELTCRSWSVIATPSNKAECVVIGKSQRTKPYCWVQETSRMKKKRFEITTCTQRRNSHVEVGQLLPRPAIRRSVLLSVNLNVQSLIAGSRRHLEWKKMRFEITTCTQRRNSHVEVGQLLPRPAIRRSVLVSVDFNVQSLIAGSRRHLEWKKMRFEITTCT